jgi:hypothetical protein
MIEHRGGTDLHRAAPEQKIVQCVAELSNATDARKIRRRKRVRELANLRQ